MKVTIEPTIQPAAYTTVILSEPSDDLNAEAALEMVKRALVAWGFHWDLIFEKDE